jgi:hypothetical protein
MKVFFSRGVCSFVSLQLLVGIAAGSSSSTGLNGINSAALPETGAGISIGQVEPGRPGKRIADGGPDSAINANQFIVPVDVFRRDGNPNVADADKHGEEVAGVMISRDNGDGPDMDNDTAIGVAPFAKLYASAYIAGTGESQAAISFQHIALQDNDDVRAINFSAGISAGASLLDGNSLLTKFVDWSADTHDVLYVIAGNEMTNIPLPTDNYNGVTVAFSTQLGGVYRQLDPSNSYDEDAVGTRTSVDIIAPGRDIEVATQGGGHSELFSGTSYAAPHVTGTVALLQQFAETRITQSQPNWDPDARHHEVMKAVLLNSADKIKDDGAIEPVGSFLGMEKTIVDTDGTSTWLDSSAFKDVGPLDKIGNVPLDLRLGAGQLNANRARLQLNPGEYDPNGASVPAVGWDFDTTAGDDSINKYALTSQINGGTYISLTLAWDRSVEFATDSGTTGKYDVGDTFIDDCCFSDLDLYLMPAGATNLSQLITASASTDTNDTLEHVFFKVPSTGHYEIWVHQFGSQFGQLQDYALAWWTGTAPAVVESGDYNGDNVVDAQDYLVWKNGFGGSVTAGSSADGNGNGVIDAADYVIWRNSLSAGSGTAASVPEPGGLAWLAFGIAVTAYVRRQRETRLPS